MGAKFDDMKGKAKEAAGDATDNPGLEREGKLDQAGANVKDKAEDVVDTVKDKLTDRH
jgi:uncharacterized protein YjbJ (UPF0337 family)